MRDEIGVKSKTDILDFVISFIVEHEKRMDHMTERLEKVTEKFGKRRYSVKKTESPVKIDNSERGTFTISIHNPEDFEPIKSIRIDWNDTGRSFLPDDLNLDSILKDIEFSLRSDSRN
jgi:uncharacterized coiled-coil protein SlyX